MSESTIFEAKSASFLEWFKALPGATFHPDIKIQDLRGQGAGRGIVATAPIPEDTVLFTIPREAIINTLTSDLPERVPEAFATTGLEDADNEADEDGNETSGPPDSWTSLILVMIYEYLQGHRSRWRPYFDVLPDEFDTLMWWTDAELSRLQSSSIVSKVGKEEADGIFRAKVLPVVEQHADVFYPEGSERLGEEQLLFLAHRMGSTIMAYAFDLENDDAEEDGEDEEEWVEDREGRLLMGMVPMADILNADAEFNAHVNHGNESLTVTTLRPIQAGEEVLNYYGPHGNGDLLRRYGYVTERHARYDVVELPWDMVLPLLREAVNVDDATWGRAVNELDAEEVEDAFVIDRDAEGPDSRGEIQSSSVPLLERLPEDLREQIHAFLKAVRKVSPESVLDKHRRDEITLSVMRRALAARLAEYGTSAADDAEALVWLSAAPELPRSRRRERLAVVVRRGEKVLLQEALSAVEAKMAQLGPTTTGEGEGDGHAAKRQKTR
ncbi:SET domain-containing protein [Xylariaceae sp. FL0804]|nr:SET domain-containing protein [Xylariaceae sp. FL0804]